MDPDFLKKLQNPPKEFRPIPFWSWNEKLSVAETRRQIAEMERVGIGGYFMHARGGLQTPYLGEEWMANIAAGVEEARERGMGAWAYDENGWPSGFGDGRVNGRGERYQQKYLRYEVVDAPRERVDGRTITHVRLEDGRLLHFYYDVNPFYVDTLDPEVTSAFLEEVYRPYQERFGAEFGAAMPGFFTDEPQVSRNGIPWSLTLPERYQEAYGEALLPLLPQLFLPVGDYRRTRYRFWHLVQELFVTHFTQQIYDWCQERGAKLTGHMVLEETLLVQITSNGAVMPHYEFFHVPGMDWLGRHINPPTTPLQVASVAHQVGRKAILSETFALTGWNVSFEELKWMFDWQMVRGVTLLCQHLEGYSLRGIRKRDYPPSLFYQQPWWEKYRPFNDYVSRLGMLLAEGEVAFDVLVLHPQSSAWLCYDDAKNEGIEALNALFFAVTDALEAAHVPFHYGDERILRRHGQVDGAALRVGRQRYSVVVVPPMDTLDGSTLSLLQQYAANGGTLIWVGRQPTLVAGVLNERLAELCLHGTRVPTPADLPAALPATARSIAVTDAEGREIGPIAVTWRRLSADLAGTPCRFYFLANADATNDYAATVRVPGASAVQFVAEDGSLRPIPHRVEDGRVVIEHRFPRGGSLALLVADQPGMLQPTAPAVDLSTREPLPAERFAGPWELAGRDPNALTLDTCDFWFDGELQAEGEHVSVIQGRALKLERPVEIRMRFAVQVAPDYRPEGELFLVLERPERYRVTLNGEPVEMADQGCYRDTSFRKVDIRGRLKPGRNELVLETTFRQPPEVYENLRRAAVFEAEKNKLTYDSEIEAIYLVGDFGVATPGTFTPLPRGAVRYRGEFLLTAPPRQVTLGDLTPQGLPFFNGTVRLRKRVTLGADEVAGRSFRFAERMAHVVGLTVNGRHVRDWYWRPYEADLDGFLKEGENLFELELTSGLRNLLGPHHLEEGESYGVGPGSFFKEPNIWGHAPWNDDYCFVAFGLKV
ncbi:MAG: hypothetical protein GX774_21570 [Armatimonadetes bacterium]|nr:hypothetical protein [Armatimonadota bacterium]